MSSDSKSRSSSRSKKTGSKRPERPDALQPVDTSPPNNGRTNLVALMLGMITTIVLIFGVFGFGSEPVVNEKYNQEQDRRKQERIDAKRAATLDELAIELAELGSSKGGNLAQMLQVCNARVEVSDKILERGPADEDMRQLAVNEGMLARLKLYGLDYLQNLKLNEIGASLEASYSPYLDDKNANVYKTARIARLTHRSFEKLRSGNKEVDDLVKLFEDTISRFPDDTKVPAMIEAHLLVLVEKETEYSRGLFRKLRERNPIGTLKPAMEAMMRNIADLLLLKSETFDRKYADRWANGSAGRTELTETVVRLLENKGIGDYLVKRALLVGNWFERNEFAALAEQVYRAMIVSVENANVVPEHRDATTKYAKDGLDRLALQGKTIEYRGQDSAGMPFNDARQKESIGIVVYWSINSPDSLKYLSDLNASARALSNKPIIIYAVCVDDRLPGDINVVVRKAPMIRIVDPVDPDSPSGKNSLLELCSPGVLPHVMLVDFGGKVHDVNAADPAKVKNETLSLLMNRSR